MTSTRTRRFIALMTLSAIASGCNDYDVRAIDHDRDGYNWYEGDCNDDEPSAYPTAPEICDGLDNDCDGQVDEALTTTLYRDADGDGYGERAQAFDSCAATEPGYVAQAGDCDDAEHSVYPGAPELCDLLDNNCDGRVDEQLAATWFPDGDQDGFGDAEGGLSTCSPPEGYVQDDQDCDDVDAQVNPEAQDPCRDGVDQDCDGVDSFCLVQDWDSLPGDAGLALYGAERNDGLGTLVAALGDLDGDGRVDFLAGAPNVNSLGSNDGAVWLASMQARVEGASTLPGTTGALGLAQISGAQSGDRLASVAQAADVNGDGDPDLLLGLSAGLGASANTGVVHLMLHDTLLGEGLESVSQSGLSLLGTQRSSGLGAALTQVGDWTGDGYPDLLVGAPGLNESYRNNRGGLYLLALCPNGAGAACGADGAAAAWGETLEVDESSARLLGHAAQDTFGSAVLSLGDFYRDGREVVAVSAPGADGVGAVYLFHQDAAWAGGDPEDEAVFILRGEQLDGRLGETLARVPDMDGDGRDELAIGVPGDNAALVLMSAGRFEGEELLARDADLTYLGPQGSAFGSAIAGGDFDGDGLSDLVFGAPQRASEDGAAAGAVYLAFGTSALSSGAVRVDDLVSAGTGSLLVGSRRSAEVGASLATGDFDGDGVHDVLVGAPSWDSTESSTQDAGAAFVLYGGVSD